MFQEQPDYLLDGLCTSKSHILSAERHDLVRLGRINADTEYEAFFRLWASKISPAATHAETNIGLRLRQPGHNLTLHDPVAPRTPACCSLQRPCCAFVRPAIRILTLVVEIVVRHRVEGVRSGVCWLLLRALIDGCMSGR